MQAARVVAEAGPGREAEFARDVDLLRKKMLARGILSMNEIPDHIYERAARERWKRKADRSIRAVTSVSALSVPMWAWLVKEDILRLDATSLFDDVRNLAATVRWFGPALMGYVAWLVSYLSAAACWFVVWASLTLFLRARPSLEYDVSRFVNVPRREYAAPVLAFLVFILPLALGAGLAVTCCLWLLLAAAYLRRVELLLVAGALLLLAGVIIAGGAVDSLSEMAGNPGAARWLAGEGYARASTRAGAADAVEDDDAVKPWMVRFSLARMETQAGKPADAERVWNELLAEGKSLPEVYNNRGIVLAQLGKTREALADFQAAIDKRPDDGPALWNAYQVHLQSFSLELAGAIQPQAWEAVGRMAPFRFRPADMDQGEWIASTLPVSQIWRSYMESREDWIHESKDSDFMELFFRPLNGIWALGLLVLAFALTVVVKALAHKYWMSCTCRACGTHMLISGTKETSDLCTPCRGQIGEGVRGGEERERRLQTIGLHGKYVKICSVVAPGSGALWAGKEIRGAVYGVCLSLALGGVTMALGGARGGEGLLIALQDIMLWATVALSTVLWAGGVAWSIWSFNMMQQRSNVPMPKR